MTMTKVISDCVTLKNKKIGENEMTIQNRRRSSQVKTFVSSYLKIDSIIMIYSTSFKDNSNEINCILVWHKSP